MKKQLNPITLLFMLRRYFFVFLLHTIYFQNISGQVVAPPDPCLLGNENTCKCNTAPILCTIELLDGYEYDMTTFPHPADGPGGGTQNMCPPPDGNGTSSQNPTWFAFLAWCTDLTLTVNYTNCIDNPNFSGGVCAGNNDFGIQAAVYSGCPANLSNSLTCNTDPDLCVNNSSRVLNITNMVVGNTYYFLVDGCCGSACHIEIDVSGACSQSEIDNWYSDIQGPDIVCKPNSYNYIIEKVVGGKQYFWTVDGVTMASPSADVTFNYNAFTPGNHQLCVDVANEPCIDVTAVPAPKCMTVCVAPSSGNGGTINLNPNPPCPGDVVNITANGTNTAPDFANYIFITKPNGVIVQVNPGTTATYTSDECESFTVYSLNNYVPCGDVVPVVGQLRSDVICEACKCDIDSIALNFTDNTAPVFSNPPASGTFACIFLAPGGGPLNYTDNCIDPGSVDFVETGVSNPCDGGQVTRTWTAVDSCGNVATHVQNLTVNPVPIAAFINPPANITISCADLLPTNLNLSYTNGAAGLCQIAGTVNNPTVTENYTPCAGGTVTYLWEFIDDCGRTITHPRVITILPLLPPTFTNPLPDITVDCNSIPATIPTLSYSNGMTGSCLINGTVNGALVGDPPTVCGGSFNYQWTATDQCNRTNIDERVITVTQIPEGNFVNFPNDITVNCNAIPTSAPNVEFSNGLLANCLIQSSVSPNIIVQGDECGGVIKIAYTYTDLCQRVKTDTQFVNITPRIEPFFVNPPANVTVTCENRPTTLPVLVLTNNDPFCPINENITATQTGSANECGETITYNWQYSDPCYGNISHSQMVTVTPMPQADFVNPPADVTVNCNQVPTSAPQLQIKNTGTGTCLIDALVTPTVTGSASECGGTLTYTWTFTDPCGNIETYDQSITVTPKLPAQFVNPPADMTVTCDMLPPAIGPSLNVVNNDAFCPINTSVIPTTSGSASICGGTLTYTWTYIDACYGPLSHTQNITVTPMPPAQFINPPADMTVTCDMLPSLTAPQLTAQNNGPVGCNINQMINGTSTGNPTVCGGAITYMWTFTDQCQNTINEDQTITVTPMPLAQFINAPADLTVNCDMLPSLTAPQLTVQNNGPVGCNINQMVNGTSSGNPTICGGAITYMWTFTDQCQRTINEDQSITVIPMPPAQFTNSPADMTVTCDMLPSLTAPQLTVQNNGPVGCNINQMVNGTSTGNPTICGGSITYNWTFTDQCQRTINEDQSITVIPMPQGQYVNPPANITVNCDNLPSITPPQLTIQNNGPNGCNINEQVNGTSSGTPTKCGGFITYNWTHTDQCNRTTPYSQTITVTPMLPPQFVNPPGNITVSCENIPLTPPPLEVTNNGPAGCLTNATVNPTQEGNPNVCGGSYNYRWTFTDECNNTITWVQTVTVSQKPQGTFQNTPPNQIVACDQVPDPGSFQPLQFSNGITGQCGISFSVTPTISPYPNACGGQITVTYVATDDCQRTSTFVQVITVQPAPQAQFSGVPPNITIDCSDLDNTPISVNYSNGANGNCLIQGSVTNIRTGSITYCGGILTDTWTFTDQCGNSINASRTITLLPASKALFTNLPADVTLDCDNVQNLNQPLFYDNGESGICEISGSTNPIITGSYNSCGGTLFVTWTFTDLCNFPISHTQIVTVTEAPDPDFVNPPPDEDLDCGGINNPPPFIVVSNGLSGPCGINIQAPLVNVVNVNGVYTNTWEYTHPCTNQTFTHTQITTTIIAPNLFVQSPDIDICEGELFDLSSIEVIDLNNSSPLITYHSAVPANATNEILPEIIPNPGDIYFIRGINAEGCDDIVNIYFNVIPTPDAGSDGSTNVCNDGTTINLNLLLSTGANAGGSWVQVGGFNLNLTNPNNVSFNNIPAGSYNVWYIVDGILNCPSDTSSFLINVTEEVTLDLAGIECVAGGKYEIKVISNGIVSSNIGTIEPLANDTFRIFNIPQSQSIVVSAKSTNNICTSQLNLPAPNCACPFVEPPSGTPFYESCEGTAVSINMSVTVLAGLQANWYSVATGGTPLVSNSLNFTHTNGLPGTYNYYVESYNPVNGCFSLTRFPITVEIISNPSALPYNYSICDETNDNQENFDLEIIKSNISSLANSINFYLSLADAQSETAAISSPYLSGSKTIIAKVKNNFGCTSYANVNLILNENPISNIIVLDESCNGKKDGKLNVTNVRPGEQYSIDNQNFNSTGAFDSLAVNNYILTTKNQNGCVAQKPFEIKGGLIVVINTFNFECDNKGTLTDPGDDVYNITLNVGNSLGIAGSYNVTGSNGFNRTFQYGIEEKFVIDADGTSITFIFEDIVYKCNAQRTIGPLNTCSTTCSIDLNVISFDCNNNGTPANPADDTYKIKFSASAVNGAVNNQFILFVDNVIRGQFIYDKIDSVSIPATGQLANIKVQDSEDVQCSANENIGPLNNCSNECILTAIVESIQCVNPNLSPTPNDDYYEVKIKANLINGGSSTSYEITKDNVDKYTANYNTTFTLNMPADDKSHLLELIDKVNGNCNTLLNIQDLSPCSGPCEVSITIADSKCSDNNTTNNTTDDIYTLTLKVKLVNGGISDKFILTVDGKTYNGDYNQDLVLTLAARGSAYLINVVDAISSECKGSIQTDLLLPCSSPCTLSPTIVSFNCDNGGTSSDVSDDVYTIIVRALASNGGQKYKLTIDGKEYEGVYGQNLEIKHAADGKVYMIDFADLTNGVCKATLNSPLLSPCSGPCTIDAQVTNIKCSNAGTNNTKDDDEYTFELLVTGNNVVWKSTELNFSGTVGNKIVIGPIKIKNAIDKFVVFFENSPNCKIEKTITVPNACSECTQTADAGQGGEISCAQNEVTLTGTTNNINGTFTWKLNGENVLQGLNLKAGQPGKYYFVAEYSDGCIAIDSVIVTISNDVPVVNISRGDQLTCEIKEVEITASATGNNLKYEWTDEAGVVLGDGLKITVNKEGKYYFRAYNTISGCSSAKVVSEIVKNTDEPSAIIYAKPTTIFDCVIKTITLFNDAQKDVIYQWSKDGNPLNEKDNSIEISNTGTYGMIAIDTISGCNNQSIITINSLIEYPIINLSVQDTLDCINEKAYISSEGSQVGPNIEYQWKDKNNNSINGNIGGIEVFEPGTYYLALKDKNNGCTNEDTVNVISFENEIEITLPLTVLVKEGDTVRLNAILNIPESQIASISWTPTENLSCSNCINPIVIIAQDATYRIEVIDIFGCKGIAEVRLRITKPEIVTIPNVISTSSDDNGNFTVYGNDQLQEIKKLRIYDRWGNLMFERNNFAPNKPELGWNGKFNGKNVEQGVYVFVAEVELSGQGVKIYAGDLTVLK